MEKGIMKYFNGLYCVHLELSSHCNKDCWMCGRRKIDKDYPEIKMNYGFMEFDIVRAIAKQLPDNIVVQFHNNGEPLLYPCLGEALDFYKDKIRCLDTNGILLIKRADEIIDKLDTITISVIENDLESDDQYKQVTNFLEIKGNRKPLVVFRLLGDVSRYDFEYKGQRFANKELRWYELAEKYNCIIAKRTLHNPMGSRDYKKPVTIPETGFCIELLNHLAIDRFGGIYPCVRFDPNKYNLLGNVNTEALIDIWNGKKRQKLIKEHIKGNRNCSKLCSKCHYWGVACG